MAIKILRSAFEGIEQLLESYERLASGPESHPGKKHIAQLLDRFELTGPNGRHWCLVFNALGPCVLDNIYRRAVVKWQRAKQLVEAVAYAHEVGVTHGDLCPGDFLFPATFDHTEPVYEGLIDDIQPVDSLGNVSPILASSLTPRVPRYLVTAPYREFEDSENEFEMIGFSGLGSILEVQGVSHKPLSQAPELLLEGERSPKADIWSLGCLVWISVNSLRRHVS